MNDLGNRLRRLRVSKKMTMEEVGKAVGVSKVAVSRWEAGQRQPKPEYIKAYADFFDVPQEWIKYGHPDIYISIIAQKELLKKGYDKDKIITIARMVQATFFHRNKNKNLKYYPSEEDIIKVVNELNPTESTFIKKLLESIHALEEPRELLQYYTCDNTQGNNPIMEEFSEEEYKVIQKQLETLLYECEMLKIKFYDLYKSLK